MGYRLSNYQSMCGFESFFFFPSIINIDILTFYFRHNAYLTYPNETEGSTVLELLDGDNVTYKASLIEETVYPDKDESRLQPSPYHAFSKAGEATGPIIFVNYGTKSDFEYLKQKGVEFSGAILLMKMGKAELGLKAKLAGANGAAGIVTFSEHTDGNSQSWPDGPDYPDGAVERGSAVVSAFLPGDLLTPGWSSLANHRVADSSNIASTSTIPIVPASWNDIKPFLESLKGHGHNVNEWSSDKPDISEWWTGDQNSPKARIATYPVVKDRHTVWNVFGKIGGVEQGELAVIIGAKRDSWCYGAVEANTGTAVLLELARIFSTMSASLDWVPLRSIYFASWDASNHNLAGSTEWVEYNIDELRRNGAVYISVDEAVAGKEFHASGHPMLENALHEALQQVNDPKTNTTLLSQWGAKRIEPLNKIGDYLPFQAYAGIASLELGFRGLHYPKNSCFDSYEWIQKFADTSNFDYHRAFTDVMSILIMKLADDPVVPFDVSAYARYLGWFVDDVKRYAESQENYSEGKIDLGPLRAALELFKSSAEKFTSWYIGWRNTVQTGGEPPVFSVHRWSWNAHLINLDKHLLDNNGILFRPWFKHIIFGPQFWHPTEGDFAWSTFPSIRDFIESDSWDHAQEAINRVATILSISANKFPI